MSNEFKIRIDFQSIEEEIFKLNEYGQIFHRIRDEYIFFEHKEDFFKIYNLDKKIENIFDNLKNSGINCSSSIYSILENINYFDFYPTLTDLIDELEEKNFCISQLEIILLESEETHNKLNRPLDSIKEMNRLHKKQIDYLLKIKDVIEKIKKSHLYKVENNRLKWYEKIPLPSFIVRKMNLDKNISKSFDYEKLRNDLIIISKQILKNLNTLEFEKENHINDKFISYLEVLKYNVAGESRVNNSNERDIIVKDENQSEKAIIEALRITSIQKDYIKEHYNKLIGRYDVLGHSTGYMLIYIKNKNFEDRWSGYIAYLSKFTDFEDTDISDVSNIKIGKSKENGKIIYHLFINFHSDDYNRI